MTKPSECRHIVGMSRLGDGPWRCDECGLGFSEEGMMILRELRRLRDAIGPRIELEPPAKRKAWVVWFADALPPLTYANEIAAKKASMERPGSAVQEIEEP